jgi:hypothetical protein
MREWGMDTIGCMGMDAGEESGCVFVHARGLCWGLYGVGVPRATLPAERESHTHPRSGVRCASTHQGKAVGKRWCRSTSASMHYIELMLASSRHKQTGGHAADGRTPPPDTTKGAC